MHSNWWFQILTAVEMASLAAVLVSLVWKRQLGQWPFLFSALLTEISVDAICLSLMGPGHYRQYFMVYWAGQLLQAVLRMGIIIDVIRSFPGLDYIPSRVYLFIGTAALVMGILAGAYSYHTSPNQAAGLQNFALLMNRCASIAFGTFAMVLLVAIKLLNFGWSPKGAGFAYGYFLRICCGIIVAEIIAGIPVSDPRSIAVRTFANCLDSFCSIAVFSYWSFLVCCTLPETVIKGDAAYNQTSKTLLSFSRER